MGLSNQLKGLVICFSFKVAESLVMTLIVLLIPEAKGFDLEIGFECVAVLVLGVGVVCYLFFYFYLCLAQ